MPFDGRLLWYYTQATNTSRYFHVNALGSLGLATDQTGAPVEEMLYYPFGVRWQNSTGFGWDEKFAQFPQRDEDIQMYEARHREYNPGLGRWMTPDPAGLAATDLANPQSWNRYAYVLNNPTTFTDPLGLDPCGPGDTSTAFCEDVTATPPPDIPYYINLSNYEWSCIRFGGCGGESGGIGGWSSESGGGGGGGASAIPPKVTGEPGGQSGFWARLNCASDYGDAHSIAAGIYAGKGKPDPVTNLFFGNAVSAFADLGLIVAGERAPTASSFATHSLIGIGQGLPAKSPVVKGPAGVIQDAAVGGAYTAVRGPNDAPITGLTGAAADAVGEGAATGAESFAAGVGIAKFGVDFLVDVYGYVEACHP